MSALDHPSTVQVGLLQRQVVPDLEANRRQIEAAIVDLADQGARLIVLPELHNSPYFCQTADPALFDLAETIPGPTSEWFSRLSARLDVVIVGSVFEDRGRGLYHNTAFVTDGSRGIVGRYRKMHIPDDPGYYEKYYFTPGDLGFTPIDTSVGRLGVLVCWDQWFPEAARLMSLAGADLLIYPTAIGWDQADDAETQARQRDAWITIQRAHAIANGLPVISVNRVGHEVDPSGQTQGQTFWGSSMVVSADGHLDLQCGIDSQQHGIHVVDLEHSRQIRRIWPFARDRRVDAYADLLKKGIP